MESETIVVICVIGLLEIGFFFFVPNMILINYSAIQGLPTFFPTNWGNITGIPNIQTYSIDWFNITSKPSTFPIGTLSLTHLNISDWGNYINQALLTSSSPTFNDLTVSSGISQNTGIILKDSSDPTNRFLAVEYSSGGIIGSWVMGVHQYGYNPAFNLYEVNTGYSLFTVDTSGNGVFRGTVTSSGSITHYMEGDYGLTWTQSMPSGTNGMIVIVYNSNAGILLSREYIYTNGAWHYIVIT